MGIQGFDGRLLEARKARNLTQDQLAARLGVTPQAISKWERGLGLPDIDLLYGIGDVLDCSIDELLGLSEPRITESGDGDAKKKVMINILAEPFIFEFGLGLVDILTNEIANQFPGLQAIRLQIAADYGMLLPVVRIRDNQALKEFEYRFISYDKVLASRNAESAANITTDFIYGHMKNVCVDNYHTIINRQIIQALVENVACRYPAVVKNVIPDIISYSCLQQVLIFLIKEKKTIRNMIKIIELLEEKILMGNDIAGIAIEIANVL